MNQHRVYRVTAYGASLLEAAARASGAWGEVMATFRRSCHVLAADGSVMCIVDQRLGAGPINLCVDFPNGLSLEDLRVHVGTPVRLTGSDLLLGDDLRLSLSGAEAWVPPTLGPLASMAEVVVRTRDLCEGLKPSIPDDGLAPLVSHSEELSQGRAAEWREPASAEAMALPMVGLLVRGILAADRDAIDSGVEGLIGLGPGLTPSGDDFLAGMMVALAAVGGQGQRCALPILRDSVLRRSADGTTSLSASLLAHAAWGTGSADTHHLLRALLGAAARRDSEVLARRVADVGHTSGWDLLAGLLLGMHLGLRLGDTQARPSLVGAGRPGGHA